MDSPTLTAIDRAAHELRNAAHAVVMGGQLLGEQDTDPLTPQELESVGIDLRAAGRVLAQRLDRVAEAARCELDRPVTWDDVAVSEIVTLAGRRAVREGCGTSASLVGDERVRVVMGRAERVLADTLAFVSAGAGSVSCDVVARADPERVELRVRSDQADQPGRPELGPLTHLLATSSNIGIELESGGPFVVLQFARA